uniref:DUF2537 domain-containing protein n=1 Tax=Saccharomonospora amisosensis TaxID=1128677 RepID=UPI00141F7579|nr:DUF2537 domain-containing protein [Saccharomonospora amisosensis]
MELRVRGERAVLTGTGGGREADPHQVALGAGLAEALHEWAHVAAAVRRSGNGAGGEVVSRRGRQLAGRVAAALGVPVSYLDPVTGRALRVLPPRRQPPVAPARGDGSTPWGTGLTVAAFFAVLAVVAILALARALAHETAGWVAVAATAVVSAGLAPSLWLARSVPIVRWIALGVATGVGLSWAGVLLTVVG